MTKQKILLMPKSGLVYKTIWILAFLCIGLSLQAQLKLKLINEDDSTTLNYAPIKWTLLNTGQTLQSTTNEHGEIDIDSKQSKVAVLITYLGFEIKKDTFDSKGQFTIPLKIDLKYLSEAVVTDQYAAISPDKSINRVIVIDKMKIKSMAATNLNDLLTNQLNVQLAQDNVLGSSLTLMGISGQNVKILLDGVPIIGRMNGNIDLSQINLNDIERIEIIEGPLSVAYGTNALAGAINIITKKKQLNKVLINVSSHNESIGRYNNSISIGLRKSNGVYRISAGRNYFDGWSTSNYVRFQEWKPKEQWFGKIQYLRKIGLFDLTIKSEIFKERIINKGLPRQPYFETAFDEYYQTKRWDNAITATSKLPHNRYLNLLASYNLYTRTKNRYLFNRVTLDKILVPEANEQDTSTFTALVLRGTYTKSLLNALLNYQIGYDINLETAKGQKLINQSVNINDFASFLSMEIAPNGKWQIKPAIRVAYNTGYNTIPLPSLNIKYTSRTNVMLRGSYARGFRAPDLKELYLFFVDVNHNITGNPNLKPEQSHNFQISATKKVRLKTNWIQPDLTFLYNTIGNRIVLANIKDSRYTYSNLENFKAITSTIGCQYKYKSFSGNLGLSNTLSSSKINDFSNPFSSFEITGNTSFKHTKSGINTSLFLKLNGKTFNFVSDELGSLTQSSIPSYTWVDLTFTKSFFNEKWSFGTGIKNILNLTSLTANGTIAGAHTNSENALQIGMGRLYFLKIDYNFVRK